MLWCVNSTPTGHVITFRATRNPREVGADLRKTASSHRRPQIPFLVRPGAAPKYAQTTVIYANAAISGSILIGIAPRVRYPLPNVSVHVEQSEGVGVIGTNGLWTVRRFILRRLIDPEVGMAAIEPVPVEKRCGSVGSSGILPLCLRQQPVVCLEHVVPCRIIPYTFRQPRQIRVRVIPVHAHGRGKGPSGRRIVATYRRTSNPRYRRIANNRASPLTPPLTPLTSGFVK